MDNTQVERRKDVTFAKQNEILASFGQPPDRPEDEPETLVDVETQRYEDLTAAEMVSMTVGIKLLPTEPDQAERIMQLSLDLEHLLSVIPLHPSQVSTEQRKEVAKLRDQLAFLSGRKVLLHLFNER